MAEIKNFNEYIDDYMKNEIINMNNPLCHNCNECCSILAILTDDEFKKLYDYLSSDDGKVLYRQCKNKLKRYYRKNTMYMLCPFTDDNTKKCRIYDIRPDVCRNFHCSTSKPHEQADTKHHTIFDLFYER